MESCSEANVQSYFSFLNRCDVIFLLKFCCYWSVKWQDVKAFMSLLCVRDIVYRDNWGFRNQVRFAIVLLFFPLATLFLYDEVITLAMKSRANQNYRGKNLSNNFENPLNAKSCLDKENLIHMESIQNTFCIFSFITKEQCKQYFLFAVPVLMKQWSYQNLPSISQHFFLHIYFLNFFCLSIFFYFFFVPIYSHWLQLYGIFRHCRKQAE